MISPIRMITELAGGRLKTPIKDLKKSTYALLRILVNGIILSRCASRKEK